MRDFQYLEPETLQTASEMLAEYGEESRLLAGGTALLLALRQRMLAPSHIISLSRTDLGKDIHVDADGTLHVSAFCTHAQIAASLVVRDGWPVLAEMAGKLANPHVRNQGTIGGNLCYGDPATDPPACLAVLDARIVLQSARARRELALDAFLVDYFETAIEPDEILTEILFPANSFTRSTHARFLRTPAEHRPMINLAVAANATGDMCDEIRLAIGAAAPVCRRLGACEDMLKGQRATSSLLAGVAEEAAAIPEVIEDSRGSESYRRDMIRVFVRRTLADVFGLEEGQGA